MGRAGRLRLVGVVVANGWHLASDAGFGAMQALAASQAVQARGRAGRCGSCKRCGFGCGFGAQQLTTADAILRSASASAAISAASRAVSSLT